MPKFWTILIIIGIIAFAFWLGQIAQDNEVVRDVVSDYGYIGIFIIAIISGFNLVVPIPAISFLPLFLESGLNVWLAIFIITVGVTLADMIAYSIGRAGRRLISSQKIISRFEQLRKKSHRLPLFALFIFAAIIPLPNEILALPLGVLGYPSLAIFALAFAGNLVFNTLYGLGLINLFDLLLTAF